MINPRKIFALLGGSNLFSIVTFLIQERINHGYVTVVILAQIWLTILFFIQLLLVYRQWRNRWGGGKEGADREISADLPGKKRQGKKGKGVKIEKKRRKIVKWKSLQNEERTFFFFFFFAFHFSKPLKFVLGPSK